MIKIKYFFSYFMVYPMNEVSNIKIESNLFECIEKKPVTGVEPVTSCLLGKCSTN